MTWVKGQSGNPLGNRLPKRMMRDALMVALNEREEDEEGNSFKRVRLVINALIKKAIDGDVLAIKEVLDRVDGKVPSDVNLNTNGEVDGLSYEDLAHGIAEALVTLRKKVDQNGAGEEPTMIEAVKH